MPNRRRLAGRPKWMEGRFPGKHPREPVPRNGERRNETRGYLAGIDLRSRKSRRHLPLPSQQVQE